MGHDISGYAQRGSKEIAYLRRSAGNPLNDAIYKALGAEQYYAGCSGNGQCVYFARPVIEAASGKLPDSEDLAPERQFIADLLAHGGSDGSWIGFY